MLKTDYPIYFNTTAISIKARRWNMTYENISSSNQTEDGGDHVEFLRFGKVKVSAQFRCTDEWVSTLKSFSAIPSFTLKCYDVGTKAYAERTVRMDGFQANLMAGSDRLRATNGTYEVQFTLTEY